MNRIVSADEARKLLTTIDGERVCHCGTEARRHRDEEHGFVEMIDPEDVTTPLLCDLAHTVVALSEREAATDAWLAEIGHLSLAAAGVELVHLREREREMQYAYDCCASFAEWANAPTNRRAHNMEHMPPVTADDAFSVVFPILQKERADLAAFANRVGAVISGRSYADVEESLRVDELPAVATQVAALGERAARAEKERDRIRLVLACERGEWAPEGWTADPRTRGRWEHHGRRWSCYRIQRGPFIVVERGTLRANIAEADYALEAIEAADRAAKATANPSDG